VNTANVLDRAADLIEEHGWGKGFETWDTKAGEGLCIEGAILEALGATSDFPNTYLANTCAAGLAVREYLKMGPMSFANALWHWNDVNAESQEQVVSVLRGAAAAERAKDKELAHA
jgi:hypothetical protein